MLLVLTANIFRSEVEGKSFNHLPLLLFVPYSLSTHDFWIDHMNTAEPFKSGDCLRHLAGAFDINSCNLYT